jgi:hypothetical protein
MMLERIDDLATKIEEVTARIDKQIARSRRRSPGLTR